MKAYLWGLIGSLALLPGGSLAQQAAVATPVAMEQPIAGDHWVYEVRDEITGKVTGKQTETVTDVTPTDVAVRRQTAADKTLNYAYDRSWNAKITGLEKYAPNDGRGFKLPLTVGATWPVQATATNGENGRILKFTGRSKVVGQESITTKAGSFDAFRVETTYAMALAANPTQKVDAVLESWYVPAINHWVKRTYVTRANKLLRSNETFELVEYGRR